VRPSMPASALTELEEAERYCAQQRQAALRGTLAHADATSLSKLAAPHIKRTLCAHTIKVIATAWHPSDSRQLVSVDQGGAVILWDAVDARVRQFAKRPLPTSLAVAPAQDKELVTVAVGGIDNAISICDLSPHLDEGETLQTMPACGDGHEGMISAMSFIGHNKLVSASGDGDLRLWSLKSGDCMQVLRGHQDGVTSLAQEPGAGTESARLVTGSADQTVCLWDTRTVNPTHVFENGAVEATSVCFFPSGMAVAAGGADGTVRIFDVRSYSMVAELSDPSVTSGCTGVQFSKSGRALYSAHENGELSMWDPIGGTGLAHKLSTAPKRASTDNGMYGLALSPDGVALAAPCLDSYIRIWGAPRAR